MGIGGSRGEVEETDAEVEAERQRQIQSSRISDGYL